MPEINEMIIFIKEEINQLEERKSNLDQSLPILEEKSKLLTEEIEKNNKTLEDLKQKIIIETENAEKVKTINQRNKEIIDTTLQNAKNLEDKAIDLVNKAELRDIKSKKREEDIKIQEDLLTQKTAELMKNIQRLNEMEIKLKDREQTFISHSNL